MRTRCRVTLAVVLATGLLGALLPAASAEQFWGDAFARTWARTDRPVAESRVQRTWVWGPASISGGLLEPYAESPDGQRLVQYFDKTRMEITHPEDALGSDWGVTNGLLARELITGQLQTGDDRFEPHEPSRQPVAGDPNGSAPSYAALRSLLDYQPIPTGWTVIQTVDATGQVSADPTLARFGVSAARLAPPTNHTVASVFAEFMAETGSIVEHGSERDGPLFRDPVYATGLPISEPYWTWTTVGGRSTWLLLQAFERRVLTYTPDNPEGWRVETGNIGAHYYQWRYGATAPVPAAPPAEGPLIVLDPGHDRSTGGALGIEYQHTLATALRTKAALEAAGYRVELTRQSDDELLYGDPTLMPSNAAAMGASYSEGYARASQALQLQPDLLISLHYNAAGSASAAGLTVYYCDYGGDQNRLLAELTSQELVAALGQFGYRPPYARAEEDGAIGKTYGHLATLGNVYRAPFELTGNRLSGVPAILTEPLFETNPTEQRLIADPALQEALAQAYRRAVDRYFGRE